MFAEDVSVNLGHFPELLQDLLLLIFCPSLLDAISF